MSGWLARWRLALRIARRDARRHKGRTALVVLMVGLPVLVITAGDTLFRTEDVDATEELSVRLGEADVAVSGESREEISVDPATGIVWAKAAAADPAWSRDEVAGVLPEGSRVVESRNAWLYVGTDGGYARVDAYAEDTADPMIEGRYELLEGRLPERTGEVAVSPQVAEGAAGPGEEIALTRDDVPAEVVGVVRRPFQSGDLVVVPLADAALLSDPLSRFYADVPGGLDWPAVRALNEQGLAVLSREVAQDPPPESAWMTTDPGFSQDSGDAAETAVMALVVASLVLEVVLLAGPAFAVGVRRQRRDLALIGATGGSAGDLRRIVLANGVVLGAGAALGGAAAGIGLAAAAIPVIEARTDQVFGPFDVPVLDVALVVAVGLVAGLAAAWFPARQAARTDVVDALAGRRGQMRTSWRSPVAGLVLSGAGLALVVLGARGTELAVAGGAALLVIGIVTATPWLIGLLAPLASRLPVAGRLAVRDATRNRSRTAPAVAAVMATVAGVTALAIGSASDSAQGQRDYVASAPLGAARVNGMTDMTEADWDAVAAVFERERPGRPVHRLQGNSWTNTDVQDEIAVVADRCAGDLMTCRWVPGTPGVVMTSYGELVVTDAAGLRAISTRGAPDQAYAALDAGRAVVFGGGAVDAAGNIAVAGVEYDGTGGSTLLGTAELPAVEVPLPPAGRQEVDDLPGYVVVPPVLTERLPLPVRTTTLVTGGPDDPVTEAQEERISEALAALPAEAAITVERGWQDDLALARLILIGVGGALVLIATLTATGLALTDARPDFATLAAVGAAPRTRRSMAMASAAVVGGGGALLGVLVGLAPGIAVAYPLTSTNYGTGVDPVLDIPWVVLGAVGIAVPLVAVAVTGVFVRSRLPMARRMT
ncbi:putative ABC transport system permease protein [Blastococcus aurantiacus]|uniref:Putative ABC transport system permease protein n=1 Tax=Blastococcus aurantiacus TaxID=1550231 RepID=A0A1G7NG06_9ACTN|nr:FtsX-like permease family protein [Blastococcus aurantiacus]SDF73025.1 putative ABC transport system permease protein [Blastococcus aurantiacus]